MLPGKKYTPEDVLRMAWARKWIILVPAVLVAGVTFVVSQVLPDRYRASTTILVIPQRVPETYVRSTVTADIGERLQSISQQILSRTRLERIVEEFNLYPQERQTRIMEDVIERMRERDVDVNLATGRGNDTSSFTIAFEAENPRTAMLVTERLASMFVQENLQDREILADSTNQFLQAQLEDARRRLIEHEKRLEEFRRKNNGQLPAQVEANLGMIQNIQAHVQANAEAASRERDRLQGLESAIEAAETPPAVAPEPPAVSSVDSEKPVGTAAQQLEAARAALRNLEVRLKPSHPDIARAKRIISELEVKADAEAATAAIAPSTISEGTAARLTAMREEAQELRGRLEFRKQEEIRLQKEWASYTSRLEAAPALESALTELMRDYSTLQEQYTALLRKSEESKIAVNLERRQIGEQFRVIDGARLPERPVSPNRLLINLVGVIAGLGVGVGLAALLEYRDTTLKSDDDVTLTLALPVLAVIPAMFTTTELRRLKRRRVLALSASLVTVVLVAAAVAWRLQLLQLWNR